ncbi:LTV-domain-containing protein [Crassisporium funariophilum]|nr:LTV-domain-containing protein [Crassisporium funariophilum]
MPAKSIFRQPGAQHFQLVHRSQRDPLINDPDASSHVLKHFERDNTKKGKSRADLEQIFSSEDISNSQANKDEASQYGVYFDDQEYDYMQHLRPIGVQEDGVDSVLIEAPSSSKQKPQTQAKRKTGIEILDLPEGVLASTSELPRNYESQQAVPASLTGFQPDMDAHLRQVLEALEDDAFVDDNLEDDFFGELVADGERGSDEDIDFQFSEEGVVEGTGSDHENHAEEDELDWEKRFSAFKKSKGVSGPKGGSDDGLDSEGGDTVGTLPAMSVIGGKGKRRKKGTSDASGYSMSSSSMYRNEALQTLDERFDQMIMKQYKEEGEEDQTNDEDSSDEAPELITSREDFDSMVNEFLNDFEILGRKMKPKLEGETGLEKLDAFRRAMGQDERVRIANGDDEEVDDSDLFPQEDDKNDRWDCETILTTYTNLENHPRLIRARDPKPVPKIVLDRKTGLPSIADNSEKKPKGSLRFASTTDTSDGSEDSDATGNDEPRQAAVGRPRNEAKDEKKARKAGIKAERKERRVEKKSTKEQFGAEVKDQKKRIGNKELRLKKL